MRLYDIFKRRDDGRCEPVEPMAIEPMDKPKSGMAKLVAVVGAAAVGLVAIVGQWEGKSNDPYKDIVGVWTVCYGETNTDMRRYSDAECSDMLAGSLADYATVVLNRNPELRGHDAQVLAASSLTYNIGGAAYSRSTVAKRFSEGRWRSACNAMLMWNKAGGKVVNGLTRRRQAERAICLRDIPAGKDK